MTAARVSADAMETFASAALAAAGADPEEAYDCARSLVWSDLAGRPTHGVWRLPAYCRRIASGAIASPAQIEVERRGPALATIDGGGGMGQCVALAATELAVALARNAGAGVVLVRNSNHLGAAGYYANLAAAHGMAAIVTSNSVPRVAPFGGRLPTLGTNPFAFAAPRRDGRSILVDLATSAATGSGMMRAGSADIRLAEGTAIDREGRPTTDPVAAAAGALLPFGGAKGSAIALTVEVLSGVLTGAGISHDVASMFKDLERPGNNGHFIVAIAIERVMPLETFFDRLDRLEELIHGSAGGGETRVRVPGEVRWASVDELKSAGIPLEIETLEALSALAGEYAIPVPWHEPIIERA